ncbi:MAG: hypothetical protein ABIT10_09770 [Alteraurantiacibacter sp.]
MTATVAPVQALDLAARAVHVTDQVGVVTTQARQVAVTLPAPQRRADNREPALPRPVIVIQTPTVMLQADRAHE